ncbi:CpsD/CapB family tyrosine-protein kinase [Fictibacillus sp. NRS-1165]|uniref:CpsD/CapB family tyrosine-protein kinase n=1 Tax=Fictibacillus sp. NRS-1165 TaxID=3144463 RepID=UPI003D1F4A38
MSRKFKNKEGSQRSLVADLNPMSSVAEQYRQLRTNIQFASVDRQVKSIVVTSPGPAEGKTTTAANLAIVLAQQGTPVLLVDTDLRKPALHYTFGVSNIQGLTSVLTKQCSLNKAITKTQVANLDLLTSGALPPNPSELLNSLAMKTAIQEMYDLYDYIVFDTPPVLAVTDPQIMGNQCDGIVMVVASGKTAKEPTIKAKELLEKAKAPILGVVLNGDENKTNPSYYQQ